MKIKIIGEPKEIAALVLAVQGRQNREVLAIGEISAKGHSNDLVTKTVRTGKFTTGLVVSRRASFSRINSQLSPVCGLSSSAEAALETALRAEELTVCATAMFGLLFSSSNTGIPLIMPAGVTRNKRFFANSLREMVFAYPVRTAILVNDKLMFFHLLPFWGVFMIAHP